MLGRCLVAAWVFLVPAVSATDVVAPDEVESQLYFHFVDIQDFPMNTQLPNEAFFQRASYGSGFPTLTCVSHALDGTGHENTAGIGMSHHTYRGYSSPSYVHYDTPENGMAVTHPERLLGANLTVNKTAGAAVHWFMRTTTGFPLMGPAADANAPLAVPKVIVQASVRSGDSVSLDDKAYDRGTVKMAGSTDPVTLVAGQALGSDGQPSGQVRAEKVPEGYVYEFIVPLEVLDGILRRDQGFTLRIDVFLEVPGCTDPADGTVMANSLESFADAQHRSRLVMRHSPAMLIARSAAVAEVTNGTDHRLRVDWEVLSAWGNYDVDVANVDISVQGPGRLAFAKAYTIQRTHEYFHAADPYKGGWVLNLTPTPPKDGTYTVTLSVPNLQGTAHAESSVTFRLEDGRLASGPPQELPAVPLGLALLVLAVLAAARRL